MNLDEYTTCAVPAVTPDLDIEQMVKTMSEFDKQVMGQPRNLSEFMQHVQTDSNNHISFIRDSSMEPGMVYYMDKLRGRIFCGVDAFYILMQGMTNKPW